MTRITVDTTDLRRALVSVKPHISATNEGTALERAHCRVEGGHLIVMATDRYSAGLAIVSVIEDDDPFDHAPFEWSAQEIAEILLAFKPRKDADEVGDTLRIEQKSSRSDLTVTDVSGLWPGKSIAHPRDGATGDDFPDIPAVFRHLLLTPGTDLDEVIVAASRLALFKSAATAYRSPLVLEMHGRSLVITAGDSFLGFLAPINESDEEHRERTGWRTDWNRRLDALREARPAPDDDTYTVDIVDQDADQVDLRSAKGFLRVVRDGQVVGTIDVEEAPDDLDDEDLDESDPD